MDTSEPPHLSPPVPQGFPLLLYTLSEPETLSTTVLQLKKKKAAFFFHIKIVSNTAKTLTNVLITSKCVVYGDDLE